MPLRVMLRGNFATLRSWELAAGDPLATERARPTAHAALELSWIQRGSAQYAIGSHRIDLHPAKLMVVRPEVEHATQLRPGLSARSFHLEGDWPRVLHRIPHLARDLDRQGFSLLELCGSAQAVIQAAVTSNADLLSGHGVASRVFEETALSPTRINAVPNWRVSRAIEHIHGNAFEPLTVDTLAAIAGLSKFHFAREFRTATGQSPYQYLLNVRLALSALYLQTGCGVTTSAARSGFADPSRFARMFRRKYGALPRAFQREGSAATPARLQPEAE